MTKQQILDHLREEREQPIGFTWTREEFSEMMGICKSHATTRIADGIRDKKIEQAGFRFHRNRAGAETRLPIYRFVNVVETEKPAKVANTGKKARERAGARALPS